MRKSLSLALLLAAVGCSSDKRPPAAAPPPVAAGLPPLAPGEAGAAPAAMPGAGSPSHGAAPRTASLTGSVLESIDAPPYTYLRLQTASGEQWAAVTQVKVKVGDQVTIANPMQMDGFDSKTLKRHFDKIIFGSIDDGSGPAAGGPPPAAGGSAPVDEGPKAHTTAAAVPDLKIPRADGAEAATVAEVYAKKGALVGKAVAVRGKVIKYNGGILGTNWVHLQDGTGSATASDHDLTVTTSETAAVGEVITVHGTVRLDKDFGAGYAYSVLVENAKLTR